MKKFLIALWLMMLTLVFFQGASALHRVTVAKRFQTQQKQAIARYLTVYLPLQQIEEWIFTDQHKLYAGRLQLRIQRQQHVQTITIFEHGRLNKDWVVMPLGSLQSSNTIPAKFLSTKKYLTAPDDNLQLTLVVTQPVYGEGPYFSGLLLPGTYITHGIYSGLLDKPNLKNNLAGQIIHAFSNEDDRRLKLLKSLDFKAILSNWQQQWPIQIINQHGWMSNPAIPFRAESS